MIRPFAGVKYQFRLPAGRHRFPDPLKYVLFHSVIPPDSLLFQSGCSNLVVSIFEILYYIFHRFTSPKRLLFSILWEISGHLLYGTAGQLL